jgi:hypothetical protein
MKQFPREFEALLSPRGRRVLAGREPSLHHVLARGQSRFVCADDLVTPKVAHEAAALLERALGPKLSPIEVPIPRETITEQARNYAELLPKSTSVESAFMDAGRSPSRQAAQECGLLQMMSSASFHAFAESLSGYPLKKKWGRQALRYRPGDYAGPHTDHHPEEPDARDGYTDVHLTFCTRGVSRQLMVYEQKGLLNQVREVTKSGLVTCYRLPFWHYVTPLEGTKAARRWLLLGTFLDDFE